MYIIGLSGKMGSGKNYVAEHIIYPFLQEDQRLRIAMVAFADQLKIQTAYKHDIPIRDLEHKTEETRKLLQYEGTEIGRAQDPTIWITYLSNTMELYKMKGYNCFIITDVRFPNEVEFIKQNNGKIIEVLSEEFTEQKIKQENSTVNVKHISEQYTIQGDFVFYNEPETQTYKHKKEQLKNYISKYIHKYLK